MFNLDVLGVIFLLILRFLLFVFKFLGVHSVPCQRICLPLYCPPLVIQLKVPKRENFSLAFFAQSEPTWACDLGSGEKNRIFYQMTPVFDGFWFFAAY
jgi:hypothetical protein